MRMLKVKVKGLAGIIYINPAQITSLQALGESLTLVTMSESPDPFNVLLSVDEILKAMKAEVYNLVVDDEPKS